MSWHKILDFSFEYLCLGHHYTEYDGVRPNPTNPVSPIQAVDATYCKNLCEQVDECRSFAVEQTATYMVCT